MFFLVPTIAILLLCGGGLWEGERGLTFHSKVVSGIDIGLQYQATSVRINLEKNRKRCACIHVVVSFNNGFKSYFPVFGVW